MASKLYVGNLSFDTSDAHLQELFAAMGEVVSAKVVTDRDTGRARGFGFVEMVLYIGILLVGYFYLWKKGALDWYRPAERRKRAL